MNKCKCRIEGQVFFQLDNDVCLSEWRRKKISRAWGDRRSLLHRLVTHYSKTRCGMTASDHSPWSYSMCECVYACVCVCWCVYVCVGVGVSVCVCGPQQRRGVPCLEAFNQQRTGERERKRKREKEREWAPMHFHLHIVSIPSAQQLGSHTHTHTHTHTLLLGIVVQTCLRLWLSW